jgi:hypothetical protein
MFLKIPVFWNPRLGVVSETADLVLMPKPSVRSVLDHI